MTTMASSWYGDAHASTKPQGTRGKIVYTGCPRRFKKNAGIRWDILPKIDLIISMHKSLSASINKLRRIQLLMTAAKFDCPENRDASRFRAPRVKPWGSVSQVQSKVSAWGPGALGWHWDQTQASTDSMRQSRDTSAQNKTHSEPWNEQNTRFSLVFSTKQKRQ